MVTLKCLAESGRNVKDFLWDIEKSLIIEALTKAKFNKTHASEMLGIPRTVLIYKMNRMKSDPYYVVKDS